MTEKAEIHHLNGRAVNGYTTWGCCWKRGTVEKNEDFILKNAAGEQIPMQSRVTAWWPDGSIKWSAHTADAAELGEKGCVIADEGENVERTDGKEIRIMRIPGGWSVSGNYLSFFVPESGKYFLEQILEEGRTAVESVDSLLLLETRRQSGYQEERMVRQLEGIVEKVSFLEKGTQFIVIRYQGTHRNNEEKKIPFVVYLR